MLDEFVKQITYLKPTIITTVAGMVIFMVVSMLLCSNFSFLGKNLKIIGFFFDLKVKDSIKLAISLLKFFLILSLFFTGGKIQTVHIACFVFLVVLINIFTHTFRDVVINTFNSAVIVLVLFLIKFLVAYLQNVLFDGRVLAAVILMAVFLLMYTVYDVFCCIASIVDSKDQKEKKNKKRQVVNEN